MAEKASLAALRAMKRGATKIVGVVAWDTQVARIADRAGVDIVSVGDSVGMNLWGRTDPEDMTLDEMILVGRAVRRGVERALLSVDFPYGVLQQGTDAALSAAKRVVAETGADLVKLDEAAEFPEAVRAIAAAGIPVFAQMGITQGNAAKYGIEHARMLGGAIQVPDEMAARLNFLESKTEAYANVAKVTLDALSAYAADVRAARQIKGGIPLKPAA